MKNIVLQTFITQKNASKKSVQFNTEDRAKN